MSTGSTTTTGKAKAEQIGFALLKNQTEAITELQKDLLLTCEEIGEEWASRLQSERALWSDLIGRLASARSAPDCLGAYSDSLSQRFKMAEDDSRRLMADYQRMAQKVSDALNNGLQPWKPGVTRSRGAPSRKPRKQKTS
jgi:hypothetical protein